MAALPLADGSQAGGEAGLRCPAWDSFLGRAKSVSPELGVHPCCLRPDLLLEAKFLEHYCYVPVYLPSPAASQAKVNITIHLECGPWHSKSVMLFAFWL